MITVLGSTGFIGGRLVAVLRQQGKEVYAPSRGNPGIFDRDLGDVIYAIGMTADFRDRPFDTVEAHVCLLRQLLQAGKFRSLLYLSSTRVYSHGEKTEENDRIGILPGSPDELYNISKLMGESLCFASRRDAVRVARLSNVYGLDTASRNFLAEVLRQAIRERRVRLRTSLQSAKDYVGIEEVVAILGRIALEGKSRLYNVASGYNISNGELMDGLSQMLPIAVEVEENAPTVVFPPISTRLVKEEFGFSTGGLMAALPDLIAAFRKSIG